MLLVNTHARIDRRVDVIGSIAIYFVSNECVYAKRAMRVRVFTLTRAPSILDQRSRCRFHGGPDRQSEELNREAATSGGGSESMRGKGSSGQ